MYEQMNTQFLATSKHLAETTLKAHGLAFAGFERVVNVQMKAFQDQLTANTNFFTLASEVREVEGAKSVGATGLQLVRESAEKAYATAQEVMTITAQTGESIGALVKDVAETVNAVAVQTAEQAMVEAGNATREAARTSERFVKDATNTAKKAR